jgi:FG-GAP-like repeat/IPT/TIG domain
MRTLRHLPLFLIFIASAALAQTNPVPLLYQTIPVSTAPGNQGFTLTVSGTGFVSGAVVQWNGSPRKTTFVSQGEVQATISAKDIAKASTASVRVLNAAGAVSSNVIYFPIRNSSSTVIMKEGTHSILTGAVAVGDFNHDGNLDVMVDFTKKGGGIYKGNIYSYLGKGDGTFKVTQEIPHVDFANTMITGDFNGKGDLDLLAALNYVHTAYVQVFPGKGNGTFGSFVESHTGGFFMVPADLHGNGKLDLATEFDDPSEGCVLAVSPGNGDGTFSDNSWFSEYAGGQVAVGDFNGDGILDLAEAGGGYCSLKGTGVRIFLGNGDGTFADPVTYNTPYLASGVAAVDLNGDGILDLVTDGVAVLLGNGDGTFTLGSTVQIAGAYPANQNVIVGDFNGDGKLDVAVVSVDQIEDGNQTIAILLGNGDGTFKKPIEFAGGVNPGAHGFGFFMGDFNNDGKLDLILEQELSQGHTHLFLQK